MPPDVLEADLGRNGVDSVALRCVDAEGVDFNSIVKLLQRDDRCDDRISEDGGRDISLQLLFHEKLQDCNLEDR